MKINCSTGVYENIIIIETYRNPWETDMPDRRPIGDRHTQSETQHACGDPSETNMTAESNRN